MIKFYAAIFTGRWFSYYKKIDFFLVVGGEGEENPITRITLTRMFLFWKSIHFRRLKFCTPIKWRKNLKMSFVSRLYIIWYHNLLIFYFAFILYSTNIQYFICIPHSDYGRAKDRTKSSKARVILSSILCVEIPIKTRRKMNFSN